MCLQGRQAGKAGLACNGDQMGHGLWGQGWAWYGGGWDRKGSQKVLEEGGPHSPSRVIKATAPPMATHAAASLGLNSVVRIHMVTSVSGESHLYHLSESVFSSVKWEL